jgi:hypothetical protein
MSVSRVLIHRLIALGLLVVALAFSGSIAIPEANAGQGKKLDPPDLLWKTYPLEQRPNASALGEAVVRSRPSRPPHAREVGAPVAPTVPRQADTFAGARAERSFVPPVQMAEPVASALQEDRVPAAPLLAILLGTVILLTALTPEALLAYVGLHTSDRLRGITMGVGLAGLIVGLLLLLASA